MGSNMAECHPVAFRWVMKGKEKGGKLIHIDPRFTRTSAMADKHVAIRAGSDIAFLGGVVNWLINNPRWLNSEFHHSYVQNYTNIATLIDGDFKDTEDLDGVFSGLSEDAKSYSGKTWQYQRDASSSTAQDQIEEKNYQDMLKNRLPGVLKSDPSWQDPNSVFQILKRHYQRYTPEMVSRVCGCSEEQFLAVCEMLLQNSQRHKTSAFVYAVGWTQHTVGVQLIRIAGIVQSLLGNAGRPGGGILALRGHASIQGSTDIPTLYHSWSGYLAAKDVRRSHDTLKEYILNESHTTSFWSNTPAYTVSLLKAWFGDAATPENDFGYGALPAITGDHSILPMFVLMQLGGVKGMLCIGQNPAVGGQNAEFQRQGMEKLEWMVVRDYFETETAAFWKRPGVDPKSIQTEVFFLPAAHAAECDGTFTNTSRLLQKHDKAVDPPDDARSDLWFTWHLINRMKQAYANSTNPRDWAIQNLLWDYLDEGENRKQGWSILDEPSADRVLREINGYTWADKKQVPGFSALKDDGSTACGCWIYSGVFPAEGLNLAAARISDDYVSPGWGFAWPANRHILYTRASADPAGNPWSESKKYTYFDAAADSGTKDAEGKPVIGKWINAFGDGIDFPTAKRPDAPADPTAVGVAWQPGTAPAILRQDGKFWLFAPSGTVDGPLPTHYEPWESPVNNPLYKQQRNPVAKNWPVKGNRYHEPGVDSAAYPLIISTYRLTEHYLAGGMSRWLPWLVELMPELFVEMSPQLAAERGIVNGEVVTAYTVRGEVQGRALVTSRMKVFQIDGRTVHGIGIPWHWGYMGLAKGDVANDIVSLVADPNVTIHEGKVFSGNLRKGPRSKLAPQLFQDHVAQDTSSEITADDVRFESYLGDVENS